MKLVASVLLLSAALTLSGCGKSKEEAAADAAAALRASDISAIKEAVKANLKDPESVQFQVVAADDKFGCAIWNAKNSMGGYNGFQLALFTKQDAKWMTNTMDLRVGSLECAADNVGGRPAQK